MAVGDLHVVGDLSFRETLHGPMVLAPCHGCGTPTGTVGQTDRYNEWGLKEDTFDGDPRCSKCWRLHHGIDHG
jgi:hypothetical protein